MALQKVSIIDQIEILSTGDVQVRIRLMVVDGTEVVASKWHRTVVPTDVDPVMQMAAVNEHLVAMGEAPLAAEDIGRLATLCVTDRGIVGRKDYAKSLRKQPDVIPLAGQKV